MLLLLVLTAVSQPSGNSLWHDAGSFNLPRHVLGKCMGALPSLPSLPYFFAFLCPSLPNRLPSAAASASGLNKTLHDTVQSIAADETVIMRCCRYAAGDKVESWLLELLCLNAAEHVPKLPARLPHPTECDLYYINRDTLFSYHKVKPHTLSVILSACLPVCLSVCLSVCLPVRLSVHPFCKTAV